MHGLGDTGTLSIKKRSEGRVGVERGQYVGGFSSVGAFSLANHNGEQAWWFDVLALRRSWATPMDHDTATTTLFYQSPWEKTSDGRRAKTRRHLVTRIRVGVVYQVDACRHHQQCRGQRGLDCAAERSETGRGRSVRRAAASCQRAQGHCTLRNTEGRMSSLPRQRSHYGRSMGDKTSRRIMRLLSPHCHITCAVILLSCGPRRERQPSHSHS
jgi:hypothetical protein